MLKKGFHKKTVNVSSSTPSTVFTLPVAENVDRVIVGAMNNYAGAGTDTIGLRVYVQLVPDGNFYEVPFLLGSSSTLEYTLDARINIFSIPPGTCVFGWVGDYGIRAIMIDVFRTGTNTIPADIEVSFLADGLDG